MGMQRGLATKAALKEHRIVNGSHRGGPELRIRTGDGSIRIEKL